MTQNEFLKLIKTPEKFNKIRAQENYPDLTVECVDDLRINNCNLKNITFHYCTHSEAMECHGGKWYYCSNTDWYGCFDCEWDNDLIGMWFNCTGTWYDCLNGIWRHCPNGEWWQCLDGKWDDCENTRLYECTKRSK